MSTYTPRPSLLRVLSESWRVLASKPGHFLALSALFLLPSSFTALAYLLLSQPTSIHSLYSSSVPTTSISTPYAQSPPNPQARLPVTILWILSNLLFSISATSSITYTAFAAFHNKPLPFLLSLKPIVASFLPLLATRFVTWIILWLIGLAFGVLMLVAYGLALLGLKMEYNSPWFFVLTVLASVVFVIVLLYLGVKWCLSNAVVVLESGWGFEPLRRSSYLIRGMEKVALSMMVVFACIGVPLTLWCSKVTASVGGDRGGGWVLVEMGVYVVLSSMLSLYGLVATTVLFVYCSKAKAPSGHEDQLAVKINDVETGGEYAVLPIV